MAEHNEVNGKEKLEALQRDVADLRDKLNLVGNFAVSNASGQSVNPIMHGFDEITRALVTYLKPLRNIGPQIDPLPEDRYERLEQIKAAIKAPDWSNARGIAVLNEFSVPFIGDIFEKPGREELGVAFPMK